MAKILVVDDENDLEFLIKQKFRRQIREHEYEFIFANGGEQALLQIEANSDIDIVLTDINMPGMDGLTLLKHIQGKKTLIRTIMVSAYSDMPNLRAAMNLGAYDFVTKPIDFNDLEITISKVFEMVQQVRQTLRAIRENNILKMYVDPLVLNFMSGKSYEDSVSANEMIEGTVVFIDICRFTTISETASADEVIELLNTYFDVICRALMEYEGHVDKFIGDAVMAVFRGDFHIDRALDACLDVRGRLQAMPAIEKPIYFKPEVSVGINTGSMISGNTGSMSLKRLDFTVIGDVVNVAQRLQSAAAQGQILVSGAVYNEARSSFAFGEKVEKALKNKTQVMNTYELLS